MRGGLCIAVVAYAPVSVVAVVVSTALATVAAAAKGLALLQRPETTVAVDLILAVSAAAVGRSTPAVQT